MDEGLGTTLITFLLRTPPGVRSVKLLGSWDNFTREYGMGKDSRKGSGYWRGCHTFKNIVCDGKIHSSSRKGRNGALKMGCTYWYYYRLDDDIDFHNDAQPSTTSCPFLPGQPVNILNVPIYLPSVERRGSRNDDVGYATPTHQTMDPKDKYTNPTPPSRPKLPRPITSLGVFCNHGTSSPAHGRSSSHPIKLEGRGKSRLGNNLPPTQESVFEGPSKERVTHLSCSKSSRGSSALARDYIRLEAAVPRAGLCSRCSSRLKSPVGMPSADLQTSFMATSSQRQSGHMRGSSSPTLRRDHNPSKESLSLLCDDSIYSCSVYSRNRDTQDNVDRSASYDLNATTTGAKSSVNLSSKHLPTLPNNPPSNFGGDPFNSFGPDPGHFQSNFSAWTTKTPDSPYLPEMPEPSNFPGFNTGLDAISPSSMTSASTFYSDRPWSPEERQTDTNGTSIGNKPSFDRCFAYQNHLARHDTAPNACLSREENFKEPGWFTKKRLDAGTITPSSITTQRKYHEEDVSRRSSPPPAFRIPTYSNGSFLDTRDEDQQHNNNVPTSSAPNTAFSENVQSMMQELIDEMSYLANMIQDGGTEAY